MTASIFGPPPRRLTKFQARQRTLWRLKFGATYDRSLSIPVSRFSPLVLAAMTVLTSLASGSAIGFGAGALARAARHESAAAAAGECATKVAGAGLSIVIAMTAMMIVVVTTLLTA